MSTVTAANLRPSPTREAARVEHARALRGMELTMAQLGVVDLIVGKVRGALTANALQQAAFRVQRRHPSLRARFVLSSDGRTRPTVEFCEPSLERLDVEEIRSGERLPRPGVALWQRVVEHEANQPFAPAAGYMFRVRWVPEIDDGGYVVLSAQHALVDGISLMRLLHELLAESAKILTAPSLAKSDGYALEPLPPTLPLLEQCPTRFYERVATRIAFPALVRSQRSYDSPFPIESRLAPEQRLETHCRFRTGQRENYERAVAACKTQGTTVGAAFAAATQFASLRLIYERTGGLPLRRSRVNFPMTMDFSMRRAIEGGSNTQDRVGLLMGSCGIGVSVPETVDFWELARRLKKSSESQLKSRQPLLFHQALDGLWNLEQTLAAYGIDYAASGGIAESVNISNVGVYPYPFAAGPLTLENVFGVNSSMKGGPMYIVWLRSLDGCFNYSATSASPAASRASGDRLLQHLVSLMEGCHSTAHEGLTLRDFVSGKRSPLSEESNHESL